jgi:ketosteroid isomerase-like protein
VNWSVVLGIVMAAALLVSNRGGASEDSDRQTVAGLDTAFQAAVKHNNAEAMARILHDEMVLVLGDGRVNTRAQQLQEAREQVITYQHQEEDFGTQTVRVWGDTAVVTARLWIQGTNKGISFERHLWFSDTYVRTSTGWRYAFGQASLRLPDSPPP